MTVAQASAKHSAPGFKPNYHTHFENVYEVAQLVESLSISIREAAFRRDEIGLRILRGEFHRAVCELTAELRVAVPIEARQ